MKEKHQKLKNKLKPIDKIWWQTPKLRRDEESDEERKATWLELFFDLVFVAAIATIAHELAHEMEVHPSWKVLVTYIFLFIPVWWVWIGNTFYNERFHVDDVGHRLYTLIQMIGVAGLAYFAKGGLDPISTKGFAVCYAFCRIVLVWLWWRGASHNKAALPMVKIFSIGFLTSIALFIISIYVDPPLRFILWGLALFADLIVPIFARRQVDQLPPTSDDYLKERFGLFTIIVLGETVAGAIAGAANAHNLSIETGIAGILGIILSFGLWFIYFDQTMNSILKEGKNYKMIWYYLHLPLMMALTGVGAGILAVVGHEHGHLSNPISWLLCGSTAISFVLFGLFELFSTGWVDDADLDLRFVFGRFTFAGVALVIGYYGHHLSAIYTIALLLSLVIIQIVLGIILWTRAVKAHGDDYEHGWNH